MALAGAVDSGASAEVRLGCGTRSLCAPGQAAPELALLFTQEGQ